MLTLVKMTCDEEVILDNYNPIMIFPVFIKNKYKVINREFLDIIPQRV